jgi:hypothetical protein
MPRTSRVLASRGEFVSGVAITSVQTTGGALAQLLRRGGQPVRTPRKTPVFGTRQQGLLAPSTPPAIPERATPTISQQLTGKDIASILRRGGQPVTTTGGRPPTTGRVTGLLPPSTAPAIPEAEIPTISQPMTGKEIASLLRRGGQPVITTGAEPTTVPPPAPVVANPEVAPKSQSDPRAPLFTQPPVVSEPLTGRQLSELGLPIEVAPKPTPAPTLPTPPVTPAPDGIPGHLAPKPVGSVTFTNLSEALSQEPFVTGVPIISQPISRIAADVFLNPAIG